MCLVSITAASPFYQVQLNLGGVPDGVTPYSTVDGSVAPLVYYLAPETTGTGLLTGQVLGNDFISISGHSGTYYTVTIMDLRSQAIVYNANFEIVGATFDLDTEPPLSEVPPPNISLTPNPPFYTPPGNLPGPGSPAGDDFSCSVTIGVPDPDSQVRLVLSGVPDGVIPYNTIDGSVAEYVYWFSPLEPFTGIVTGEILGNDRISINGMSGTYYTVSIIDMSTGIVLYEATFEVVGSTYALTPANALTQAPIPNVNPLPGITTYVSKTYVDTQDAATLAAAEVYSDSGDTTLQNEIDTISLTPGPAGPQGPKGDKGDKGDPGTDGTNGTNGTNGIDGTNGTNGTDGAQGIQGIQGIQGDKGDKGDTGDTGPAGPAPIGSGNEVIATPADGSSGVSALRS